MKTFILLLCSYAAFGQMPTYQVGEQSKVELKLESFRQQRNFAKEMQFIGIGVAAASLLIKPKTHLPFVGAGMYVVGMVIDFDASRHLRIHPRKKKARK